MGAEKSSGGKGRSSLQEAVRRDEKRIQAAFEGAALGIALAGTDGRIVGSNSALHEMLGYGEEELRRITLAELIHSGDAPADEKPVGEFTKGKRDHYEVEKRFLRKDGRPIWGRLTATLVKDAGGNPQTTVAVLEEITERKRAEEERERLLAEVRHRVAELDTTIAAIPDGLVTYDTLGRIDHMNPAADKMFAFTPEERRLTLAERLERRRIETPDGRLLLVEELPSQRAVRGETVRGVVLVFHRRDGRVLWLSTGAAPIRDSDGVLLGAVAIFTDVTPLHELEEQRTQHMLGMSHGLRTPLTVVQGQSQLLLRELVKAQVDGRLRRSAEAIIAASQRMSVMLRNLVDLTNLEAGQPLRLNRVPLDLRSFVLQMKERLAVLIETERLRVKAPEGLPPVLADPDRVERILMNLLSNAFKYSAPDTEVVVSLARRDGQIVTSVIDRGRGIPPDVIPRLFKRYREVRPTAASLGLSLYITRGLVEEQGGSIWVKSEVGKGSTFSFTLPLA
ncbi:MAG: sensor histidine kinase [Chloroflexota bacterium]